MFFAAQQRNTYRRLGGSCKALVKSFDISVSDGNGLQIQALKDGGDDAFEAGIEIATAEAKMTIYIPDTYNQR